jgi:hypothetical protein
METCIPRQLVVDEGDYVHGTRVRIPMGSGHYEIQGMSTPHGTTRHVTIYSRDASSCVSSISLHSSGGTCYVHWLDESSPTGQTMWHYDGIDPDAILWHFLMTLSLGSVGNLIKETAGSARNCEPVPEKETLPV